MYVLLYYHNTMFRNIGPVRKGSGRLNCFASFPGPEETVEAAEVDRIVFMCMSSCMYLQIPDRWSAVNRE